MKNICYKVVSRTNRFGSNYTLLFGDTDMKGLYNNGTRKESRVFQKFFPQYKKGEVVKAVRGSQGIFCFLSCQDADDFRWRHGRKFINDTIIIQVRGIGEPNRSPKIIPDCGWSVSNLLDYKMVERMSHAPSGSITFKEIKVLE
jgi:hypothetical protein